MTDDGLARDLYAEICKIPLIDPHSHIDPHRPTARGLDDILGYHYYTELAHSTGLDKARLAPEVAPRECVRAVLSHMGHIDNTAQYRWFDEIARTFFGFEGDRITAADADGLCAAADRLTAQPDWEEQILRRSNIEKVFLTNDFDDPLEGFDTNRYVPCLRTDDLVFNLGNPEVRERLTKATGVEVGDAATLRKAISKLFEHFTRRGARACAVSLPPHFSPQGLHMAWDGLESVLKGNREGIVRDTQSKMIAGTGIFWVIAEHCREFKLPFDLMIGVNRRVYEHGVYQGQDLFDQRTSLIQYAKLFNDFPEVTFCVSVLSSGQNQELVSYSWIFPNVVTSGHWWYSNIPAYVEQDARARLHGVPKTKQIGYYSDMYKLEFGLPKFNMYRRLLSRILADDFVREGVYTEKQAVELARLLLRDNVKTIFKV